MPSHGKILLSNELRERPWLTSPGALPRPDFAQHMTEVSALTAQRRALIDEVKELQSLMQKDPASVARDEERKASRERLNDIDGKRKVLREQRAAKDAEIAKLRKKRAEIAESLREVQLEVGGFKSVKEIDEAVEFVMRKMETSGGGLGAEKRNQQLLHKLEQAKSHLSQLQPLMDAIKEVAEQETLFQQEYLAISEQIGIHNKEYDEEMQKKRALDKEAQNDNARRSNIYKKRTEISSRIDEISQSIDALYAKFREKKNNYDTRLKEAHQKYIAKQEELREQRRKEYEERKNARKIAAKTARAVKRQNPYAMEISACTTLIQYLEQKKAMIIQEEEDRKKREAAAHFDPTQVAPAGCIVLNQSKWAENQPLSKAAKKHQKQTAKAAAAKESSKAPVPAAPEGKDRMLRHPEDKIRLFQMIETEPAISLATIDEKVHQIEEKKKEYEQHIQTGKLVLSSGDDEDEKAEDLHEAQEVGAANTTADAVGNVNATLAATESEEDV